MFNPITASQEIKDAFTDYITTTFDFADPDYADELKKSIQESGAVAKGPYLEVSGSYESGESIAELIAEHKVSPLFDTLENCAEKDKELKIQRGLYLHQIAALEKANARKNLVVTTGTGSGKTECFLIPVIDSLLKEEEAGTLNDAVRAIIIYPMNALANDQIKRLQKLLKDHPTIRFGLYNGNTEQTKDRALAEYQRVNGRNAHPLPNEVICRDEMQTNPPHILITNYSMLEYMLRDHLNQQYKSGLLKKDFENVDFMTISALAYKVAGDMNGLEDLKQWLSDCYDKKEVFGYKHVIVDEGQDFGLLGVDDSANEDSSYGCQIIDILELVALGNGGTFYLFCDRNQIVQGAGADAQLPACISDSECKLTLHRKCRNTYEIATTSIKPLPKNDRNITAKQGPKSGIKPHMYAIANSDGQIEYINKAIDSLKDTCESITILSVKNTLNNSILSPYTECESVGDYSRHYTHKGKECLFSNCSKFKGLEADAIILIDVDSSTFDKGAMYFYVGASRARRNLEIISNATKEDCALMVRSLNPKAPLRRDPISMLKVLLSCDVDLIE